MLTQTLTKDKTCKYSVRFKAPKEDAKPVFTSVYLMNSAYEELERPDSISVSVVKKE